jgi:hypothetical protein
MSELARYHTIANQLAIEEPAYVFFPVCRWDRANEPGYYTCYPGCGKPFLDLASKRAHQEWCRQVSTRESERNPSMSRLLGG